MKSIIESVTFEIGDDVYYGQSFENGAQLYKFETISEAKAFYLLVIGLKCDANHRRKVVRVWA